MTTKIFVGNLPVGTTNEDLQLLFDRFGTITESAVLGSFGFVHMSTEREAKNAVANLNRHELYGTELRVELSLPSTQGKMKHGDNAGSTKIFVGNLKSGTSDTQLQEIFEPYGNVLEAVVIGGYGFVRMEKHDEAKTAIKDLNGFKLNGQPISVEVSTRDTQGKTKSGHEYFERPRGGGGWGGYRGRGRGMSSARFDPYAVHGGAGGWMGRADPYGAEEDLFGGGDLYRQSMLPAPPSLARAVPAAVAPAAAASSSGGEDVSFARDLLKLYTENPAAFDAYARDPVVRRSLKLDGQEQILGMSSAFEDSGLKTLRDYPESRLSAQPRLSSSLVTSTLGSSLGVSRRGALGLGSSSRLGGQMLGFRQNQSQLYMPFD